MREAEEIRLKYDGRSKEMPGDELERWERAIDDCDRYKKQIEALEKQTALEGWSRKTREEIPIAGRNDAPGRDRATLERKAFQKLLSLQALTPEENAVLKAYQADDPASGGFFVAPQEIAREVVTLLKDLVFVRSKATVIPLERSESLGVAAIDVDPGDPDWTTELSSGNEELTLQAGKRELKPNAIARLVKLSKRLIRQSTVDVESLWLDRIAYKFSVAEEKAFLTGDGFEKPLGVFVASSNGIGTGRDVTAANNNKVVADDFIAVKYKLKAGYRAKAEWLMHRDVVKAARLLKDSNGNYLWATGYGPGQGFQGTPDTLLGLPVNESEYAPNTFTTGLYMAIVGDFSKYVIADAMDMQVQVLQEMYALTNQMGYVCHKETDGQPVLEEAFSRLVLA